MTITSNDWGFSVEHSNPFRVFPILQKVAKTASGKPFIDLSRGDPSYGAAPSVRGREFMGFLMQLDAKLNNQKRLFLGQKNGGVEKLLEDIGSFTRSQYVPVVAERYLKDLSEFIQRCIHIGKSMDLEWTPYDILRMLFEQSVVTGGTYHDPQGELLSRAVVAWWHKKTVGIPIDYQDLVFTSGASHAIGSLFKLLGNEGIGYLTPGDRVLVTSPVYAPYNTILENRGLEVVPVSLDPNTGQIEPHGLDALQSSSKIKLLLMIDPNNPTGFSLNESALRTFAEAAERHDALVITDEVYSSFFENRRSLVDWCPKRTLRIQARSKIERSTGLRFGDVLINKQANIYLTEHLLKGLLPANQDFKTSFIYAKGPGGIQGEFQHTTFVPGPSQFLGIAHIVLGAEERQEYREWMEENGRIFTETLGLPYQDNRYYLIFDMNELPGAQKKELPPEQKIVELAQLGVVVLPAHLFFSEQDRKLKDRRHTVRVSLANAGPDEIKRAAQIIKEYLTHS